MVQEKRTVAQSVSSSFQIFLSRCLPLAPATRTVSQKIAQPLFLVIFNDTWQIIIFLKLSVASFADKVRPRAGKKKKKLDQDFNKNHTLLIRETMEIVGSF